MPQIKSIKIFKSVLSGSEKVVKEYLRKEKLMDMNGNLLFEKIYQDNGLTESISTLEYDNAQRIVEKVFSLEENAAGEKTNYKYKEDGKLIQKTTAYLDGHQEVESLEIEGPIEKWVSRDERGKQISEENIVYDNLGNELNRIKKDIEGEVIFETSKTLEENHRLKNLVHREYGNLLLHQEFSYDDLGRVKRRTHLSEAGNILYDVLLEYNERNQIIEELDSKNQKKYYYNEDGLLERTESLLINGKMIESFTEYSYTADQLVIEEVHFQMGTQFEMEPGVTARTGAQHFRLRYEYEFWDEALVYAPSH